jgi:hypothetical protein
MSQEKVKLTSSRLLWLNYITTDTPYFEYRVRYTWWYCPKSDTLRWFDCGKWTVYIDKASKNLCWPVLHDIREIMGYA